VPTDDDRRYAPRPSLVDICRTMPVLFENPELNAPDSKVDEELNEEEVEWYEANMETRFGGTK